MNIVSDDQYPLLMFIAACNGSSYCPTAKQVMLWWRNPEPTKAEYRTVEVSPIGSLGQLPPIAGYGHVSALSRMANTLMNDNMRSLASWKSVATGLAGVMSQAYPSTRQELVKPAETMIEHLLRLTWLEKVTTLGDEPELRLTELGRALLRDRERESRVEEDVNVVVLEADDPLAYPLLVGQLANAGAGLLADPYLKLNDLHRIVVSTQLTRLLVAGNPRNSSEVAAMQTYLDSASLSRHVEVRKSTDLHDRVLLTADGDVLTLGTSLNGVGTKTTVLSPLPLKARDILREVYETLWTEACLVGPQPPKSEPEVGDQPDDADQPDGNDEQPPQA